jgi:uncharacterized membrane protein
MESNSTVFPFPEVSKVKILLAVTAAAFALPSTGCDQLGIINRQPSTTGLGGAGGGAGSGGVQGAPSGQAGAAGLPCDVEAIVVKYCTSCHGSSPSGGAPRALVTYADLTRKDLISNGITEAQAALQRMQSKSSPMPPSPAMGPTSGEISTFQSWIANGYPTGTCGVTSTGGGNSGGNGSGGSGGAGGAGGAGGSSSGGTTPATGLPCDVQAVVVNNCASCHGSAPSGGAPRSLVTYTNLTMADPANSSMTEAQVALQRMQNTTSPMPPSPAAPASSTDITAFQNWINSGYPKGTCGATGGSGGSAAGGAGGGGIGGAGGSSGGSDAGVAGGVLPCDVQTLLVNRCDSCHGSTPAGGAPRSLVTYSNLTMADPANTSMTEAQVALQRMQSTSSPMPPSPASPATSVEMTALQNWISAGYPSGPGCTGDAGTTGTDPLNASPTCTSNTTWSRGNSGSSSMNPGQACISCHGNSGGEAPRYVIAGTLYPTGHEPNNCNGTNGNTGARVVVTGSNGTSVTLTPNSAGNFYSSTSLPGPYQAKVVDSTGKERVMVSTAPNGDCNSCHTQTGANSAPGRITLP